jgi:hypothetical protein
VAVQALQASISLCQNWRATVSLKQVLCILQGFGGAFMLVHSYYVVNRIMCLTHIEAGCSSELPHSVQQVKPAARTQNRYTDLSPEECLCCALSSITVDLLPPDGLAPQTHHLPNLLAQPDERAVQDRMATYAVHAYQKKCSCRYKGRECSSVSLYQLVQSQHTRRW